MGANEARRPTHRDECRAALILAAKTLLKRGQAQARLELNHIFRHFSVLLISITYGEISDIQEEAGG